MALYTPRGLKIRLDPQYAFGLIARLYPDVDAFRVLKTTEGVESLPGAVAFVVALVSFGLHANPWQVGLSVLIAAVVSCLIRVLGLFIVPGLVPLATLYTYFAGFGLYFVLIVTFGYFTVGWLGVVAFFGGRLLAGVINLGIEMIEMSRFNRLGVPLTGSEISFFHAYRLHATALNRSIDLELSPQEQQSDGWRAVYDDLMRKWPDVAHRCSAD